MLNISMFIRQRASEFSDKEAIRMGNSSLTYAQLEAGINQVANGLLSSGLKKGDHIALSCPNIPLFPMVYYGILRMGGVVVPLNVLLKPREITYHLNDSEAKAYFCFQGSNELPMGKWGYDGFQQSRDCEHFWYMTADPTTPSPWADISTLAQLLNSQPIEGNLADTKPDDTAVILYTSGTTGFPKGAELSHSNMTMNAMVCRDLLQLGIEDVHVIVLPLFHSFGQTVQMNAGLFKGNTLILIPRFQPEAVLDALQNGGGSVLAAVPTMYWSLLHTPGLDEKFDMKAISKNLRLGVSGGAALPVEIIEELKRRFNIPIIEGYGLSETSPVATFNHLHKGCKVGSVGTPVEGCEVRVLDPNGEPVDTGVVGEIAIRGTNVMKGYYNRRKETKEAFRGTNWLHTGDLGKLDNEGYLFIVDRLKDMIIRGGFNIYPREIEETLLSHPDVSLAAVIGVPDDEYGEEIKAYLVPKPHSSLNEDSLRAWCQEQMAAYKYPRIFEFREALPMNATGKLLKKELRAENSPT